MIQDKAQMYNEDEEDFSDSDYEDDSGSSTSSMQDQLEAMDSVKLDGALGPQPTSDHGPHSGAQSFTASMN